MPLSLVRTWFVPLPVCDHPQGVYFPPNIGGVVFRVLFQETIKQTKRRWRLEVVIGMQTEILDGHLRSLFEWLIWKEDWTLTIEDFDLRFDSLRAFRVSSSRERAVQPIVRSAISSFSNLNRAWNVSQGLFYHVPLKRDQETWRLKLNYTPNVTGCTWKDCCYYIWSELSSRGWWWWLLL